MPEPQQIKPEESPAIQQEEDRKPKPAAEKSAEPVTNKEPTFSWSGYGFGFPSQGGIE